MGACTDYRTYKTEDVEEAKTKFQSDKESDGYENGHSYSGTIAMLDGISNKVHECANWQEAIDCMNEEAEKWGCAEVIKFKDKNGENHFLIGGVCSS